jgi:hypothetical protein
MIKYLITDYKKYNLWGDIHLDIHTWQPLIGKAVKVKIMWMFWVTYKEFIYDRPTMLWMTKKKY